MNNKMRLTCLDPPEKTASGMVAYIANDEWLSNLRNTLKPNIFRRIFNMFKRKKIIELEERLDNLKHTYDLVAASLAHLSNIQKIQGKVLKDLGYFVLDDDNAFFFNEKDKEQLEKEGYELFDAINNRLIYRKKDVQPKA